MRIIPQSVTIEDKDLDGLAILKKIELAGRVCYRSEAKITPESSYAFVRGILKRGHESVIEHVSISVRFICDRGVSHEAVRHRIASVSQESTRFCNYGKTDEIQVIEPPDLTPEWRRFWLAAMKVSEWAYLGMVRLGCPPQIARSVLPNSLKTEFVFSANLREWRHFFRLRCAPAAHPQMRSLALDLLRQFRNKIMVVFDDVGLAEDHKEAAQ